MTRSRTETESLTLIRTKLQRPWLPGDLIPRRRLLDRLQAGSDRKLTLISAMAGAGKTTLMAQWLGECPQPSAWLSLDERDNDRIVFLSYLCGAIRTVFPSACDKARNLLHAPQTPSARAITTLIVNELDLMGEAYNAVRLAENMAGLEGVHIPCIYPEFTTSRVLVIEYIEGVKISDIEAIETAGLDRQIVARNALRAIIKQLLIDGFFHADPHPGNVLVNLQTGEITFLDTGMVGELDLTQRVNLIQLLIAVQQQDVAGMGQVLRNLSVPFAGEVDEKAYARDFKRVIGRQLYIGGSAGFGQTVSLGLDLLRRHGLRLDPNLTMAVKALMQAEAFATLLYPEGGIVAEGAAMVQEMAVQEITADKVAGVVKDQVMMSAREVLKRLPSLQDATIGWLDQYQKGRLEVYVDTSGLAKEVDKLSSFGRQVVIAMILVGMIIGSAIATTVLAFVEPVGTIWDFAFRLSYLGFVAAMVVGILIVLRLLWRWIKGDNAARD